MQTTAWVIIIIAMVKKVQIGAFRYLIVLFKTSNNINVHTQRENDNFKCNFEFNANKFKGVNVFSEK